MMGTEPVAQMTILKQKYKIPIAHLQKGGSIDDRQKSLRLWDSRGQTG